MCLIGTEDLSSYPTSDIKYMVESDELNALYMPYITTTAEMLLSCPVTAQLADSQLSICEMSQSHL
jgi:hypothetical protein